MKWIILSLVLFSTTAIADENKLKNYQKSLQEGFIETANTIQKSMNDADKEKSRKFYKNWKKQQEINKKVALAAHVKKMLPARKAFAKGYEQDMLSKGLDIYASTQGKDHTTFKIKFILVNRPLVHRLINNEEFTGTLKGLGFNKLIMTDGYDDTWNVKL